MKEKRDMKAYRVVLDFYYAGRKMAREAVVKAAEGNCFRILDIKAENRKQALIVALSECNKKGWVEGYYFYLKNYKIIKKK